MEIAHIVPLNTTPERSRTHGQISLDAIFTIVVLIVLILGVLTWFSGYQSSQEEILLRNELRLTAATTATFITSAGALSGATFTVERSIPKLSYHDTKKYSTIVFHTDTNTITVSESITGKYLTETISFPRIDANISYSDTNGMLVVSHA